MILKLQYNSLKDAQNWVETVLDKNPSFGLDWKKETAPIPNDLKQKILHSQSKESQKLVEHYIKSTPWWRTKREIIEAQKQSIAKIWGNIENEFIKILERITAKKFPFKSIDAFITTLFICPYNYQERYFFLSYLKSLPEQITLIAHELLHFHFIYHYRKEIVKKVGEENFEKIKEALTFLLNEKEFEKIILVEDQGYKVHQGIRKKLLDSWRANKDFESLMREAVDLRK